ncbi:small cell adhesion glycoprotein-like isoform X2 [Arapaima gigas]
MFRVCTSIRELQLQGIRRRPNSFPFNFETTAVFFAICTIMKISATTPGTTVLTTAAPSNTDSTVVGVVIFLIVLTLVAMAFLLYRYLCRNKGDYRTTGEPVPGEDMEQADAVEPENKKEYFI